jgi:hypothetical protein
MEQNEGNLCASGSEVVDVDAVRFEDSTSPAPSPALGGPDEPDEPRPRRPPAETAAELPAATEAALLEMVLATNEAPLRLARGGVLLAACPTSNSITPP